MSSHTAITVTIAVISGLFGLTLGYYQNMNEGISRQPDVSNSVEQITLDAVTVPIKGSPMRGGQNAIATVVVFTDFTVPATKPLYTQHLDHAFQIHGDKLAVVYKAYPLQSETNNDALLRAKFAAAAQIQDKFWAMADKLIDYGTQPLSMEKGLELAQAAGLDTKKLANDIESPQVLEAIRADIQLGKSLGLTGAPSLFINGKELVFSDNLTQKTLMDGINAELTRLTRLAAQPAANYYLGSLVNQQLDALHAATHNATTDDLGRPVRGAKNALVTIVEYSDYECPFCARVEPTLARILREYPDSVRIVFSHNPLPFHKHAMRAHQAAYAAGKQGKFWEMHDLLFKNQKKLTDNHFMQYAQKLDLDMNKFKADIDAPETLNAIQKNLKEGTEKNISGAPNFLINGVPLTGAQPYESFKKIIEQELKKAKLIQKEHNGMEGDKLYAEIIKKAPKIAPKDTVRLFVETDNAPILGNPNAPITIVEFTDFECPFCSRANATLHQLQAEYPDKIRIVFKNNPLSFHKNANAAHRAALAAQAQGKFREMHDLLFANQKSLSAADLEKYAAQIGLDLNRFRQDMESDAIKKHIEKDLNDGQNFDVRGTPHFFINGTRLKGAQPIDKFRAVIDEELKIAQPLMERNLSGDALYKAIVENEKMKAFKHSRRPMARHRLKPMEKALDHNIVPADHNIAPVALEKGDSYARGPEDAPVTIYQFSEFQCPFCSRVEPTLNELMAAYPGKIRIIFKSFPLAFHKNAKIASEAALAAGAQGKFWEMHELLFQNQKQLDRENLSDYARQLGLNIEKFDADLDAHVYAPQVDLETKQGQSAGVSGTPTFVINGKLLPGAQPLSEFKAAVNEALNPTP